MAEATVMVADVTTKEGSGAKGPWRLFNLVDGNGDRYTTFDAALGARLLEMKGRRAAVVFEVTEKGNNLKSATEAVEAKASGGGRDPGDAVQVMIIRQNSWSHAARLTAAALDAPDPLTARELFDMAAPLAHAIELDVRRGYLSEDDVPF